MSTESDYVKSKLIHKLHHIPNFGIFKLNDFKELVHANKYKSMKSNPNKLGI